MKLFRPISIAVLAVSVAVALPAAARSGRSPVRHEVPSTSGSDPVSARLILSPGDQKAYSAAFAAVRRGDFTTADAELEKIHNRCLVGRVSFEKLMHPAYPASYAELKAWLLAYHDQPEAERVWAVAKKRQIAADLALPSPDADAAGSNNGDATWSRVERVAQRLDAPERPKAHMARGVQAAREAFYAGDLPRAYKLAERAGERWILGLAAFRLKHFDVAVRAFEALSRDHAQNDWVRSAGAFWAARAAIAGGHAEQAPGFLRTAATTPYTFYGLIAERQLGLEPAVGPDGMDEGTGDGGIDHTRIAPPPAPGSAFKSLLKSNRRAYRAAAYAQLGLKPEAGLEIRTALLGAGSDGERRRWVGLAISLGVPLSSPADLSKGKRRLDLSSFQTPDFYPLGGYTLDKALVYALVKQESRFNAEASSTAGAYGLMQITPSTAAHVTQDDGLIRDPTALKDPALNLRIGQDYVSRLLEATKGDLLHAIAAYNAGPGVIMKTVAQMPGADSLLVFESMPSGQTREYAQRVIANYWIYRLMSGQPSRTLDAAASAEKAIRAVLDQP